MKTFSLIMRMFVLYLGISVLICMYAVAFAAPPGSQPPSTQTQQAPSFPDIKAYKLEVDRQSPQSGDIIFF